jgi:hypothetical protein
MNTMPLKLSVWFGFLISFILAIVASIYFPFPDVKFTQISEKIWVYLSTDYVLSLCSLLLSVYNAVAWMRKLLAYLIEWPISWRKRAKKHLLGWLMGFIILIGCLIIFLPIHTIVSFIIFAFREAWLWREKYKNIFTSS